MESPADQATSYGSSRVLGFLLKTARSWRRRNWLAKVAGSRSPAGPPHLPELPPAATGACSASATCSAGGPPLGTPCTKDGAPQTTAERTPELGLCTEHAVTSRHCTCGGPGGRAEGRQELPAALDLLPPPPPAPPLLRRQQVHHLRASQSDVGLHHAQGQRICTISTLAPHAPVQPASLGAWCV